MTDIRARITAALVKELFCAADGSGYHESAYRGLLHEGIEHVADVLLSLSGIAIVDTSRIDKIAEAIARNWPDTYAKSWPWADIPEDDRQAYREMARAAVLAAAEESA